MDNYRLAVEKKESLQISNDAFFYLLYGEDPLDEANLEEAKEITAKFPDGFEIGENWEAVEDSDLIEAEFTPYEKTTQLEDFDFDLYEDMSSCLQHQLKWIEKNRVRSWFYYKDTGKRELHGDFDVYTNQKGLKCFKTGDYTSGKGCLFFIKRFKNKA